MLTYLEFSPATQAMLKNLQGQMITKMYFRVLRPQDIPLYPFPIAVIILDAKYDNFFVVVSRKYCIFFINVFIFIQSKAV